MNRNGITIIELVLVVAIVASIVMILGPMFEATSAKVSVENEGRRIIARIRTIRRDSINEGREHIIRFFQGSDLIKVSIIGEDGVERETGSMRLERSIDLVGTTFPQDTVSFNLLGEPNRGGSIELVDLRKTKIYLHIIPETGKIILEKENK